MGKSEDAVAEKPAEENAESQESSNPSEEQVEDVDSLRTVIKLDEKEGDSEVEEENVEEKPEEDVDLDDVGDLVEESEEVGGTASASTREALEQKRALLQRIKDFDLQIKKNQQDIADVVRHFADDISHDQKPLAFFAGGSQADVLNDQRYVLRQARQKV